MSIRRIINCVKNLMRVQGWTRRRAIRAALEITKRAPVTTRRASANADAALEYLIHRNHTMARR